MHSDITIRQVRNKLSGSLFRRTYKKLCLGKASLSVKEAGDLLRWGIIFFNQENESLKKLGYCIILRYANLTQDYIPLYDISLVAGFVPVAKFIETNLINQQAGDNSFFRTFLSSYMEGFKSGDKYLSQGQKSLVEFEKKVQNDFLMVAPTSYGKSGIIISRVKDSPGKKVCILVPSKALIAQTKRYLLKDSDIVRFFKRVITHPEMYKGNEVSFVSVLTQERFLRLLEQHKNLSVDLLLVDEAHTIMGNDDRHLLLLQVILIAKKRAPHLHLSFFSPFIAAPTSIETPHADYQLQLKTISEFIKVEKFYVYNIKKGGELTVYDQFLDEHFKLGNLNYSDTQFIHQYKSKKNIVFLNRPRDIEQVALQLSNLSLKDDQYTLDESIELASKAISEYLHKDYNLLKCLKCGVLYHHGKMPEVIRLYVEDLFSKHTNFQFIVTNSTLLEGINIPAESIFILANKRGKRGLSRSEFRNLTGRVCRFSEVFKQENRSLKMLEPQIYLVNGEYTASNFNAQKFIKERAQSDLRVKDKVENVLLLKPEELSITDSQKALESLEYLENIEPQTTNLSTVRYVTSDIAKLCFKNNIHDFDIYLNESSLIANYERLLKKDNIQNPNDLMEAISSVFIQNIQLKQKGADEFLRLRNKPARDFYAMFLDWRMNSHSYSQMINSFLRHWKNEFINTPYVYVGRSWGEVKKDFEPNNSDASVPLYIDISTKRTSERINIAIVKIQEEQAFIDYNLMKYVEVLNDLGALNKNLYERIKYGTANVEMICLLKNGISIELAKTITKDYYQPYIQYNFDNDNVTIKPQIIEKMSEKGENEILIFELSFHLPE
jgi:hypothetical protein